LFSPTPFHCFNGILELCDVNLTQHKKGYRQSLKTLQWTLMFIVCVCVLYCCSGVEGCLTAAVVVSPVIREKLASAMIQTYTSVDVVEGLDVDKEEFDKFTSRY